MKNFYLLKTSLIVLALLFITPCLSAQSTFNALMENAGIVLEGKDGSEVNLTKVTSTEMRVQEFAAGLENPPTNSAELTPTQLHLLQNATEGSNRSTELSTLQLLMKNLTSGNQTRYNYTGMKSTSDNGDTQFYVDKYGISLNAIIEGALKHIGIGFNPTTGKLTLNGDVCITGTLDQGSNIVSRIDHPLNPYDQFLDHSTVVAPKPMNLYSGQIITDEKGSAMVALPDYFESINIDFNYHLTVIGKFAQAIVAEEIYDNQFKIQTSEPNVKVSWQVIGQRNDAYHQDHLFQEVQAKTGWDKGKLSYDPQRKHPYSKEAQKHWNQYMSERGLPTIGEEKAQSNNINVNNHPVGIPKRLEGIQLTHSPNPTSQELTINLELPASTNLSLQLFDINGRPIRQLAKGQYEAGSHQFKVVVNDLTAGIYEYALSGKDLMVTKKIMVK